MAVIGKIRERSGLLIGIIGVSILGFLLMDVMQSKSNAFSGSGRKDNIGTVNGEEIKGADFDKKFEENVKGQEEQMRGQPMSDDMKNYMRTATWDQLVNEAIFKDVYEKLGIAVTPEEMGELATGENAHPYIIQNFTNPQTGQFEAAQVRMYLQSLDKDQPGAEPGSTRKQWMRFEDGIKKDRYQNKYNALVTKGLYVPTWQSEMAYNDQNRAVDFKYVQLPYTDVADADVKVTDEDLQKYINDHAAMFKTDEETRKIQYVTFDINASSADTAAIVADLEAKREEFAKGATVSDDSLFVKIYSEIPFNEVYYTADQLTTTVKDSFFQKPVKSIVGPYLDGGSIKLAKISDRKGISDSVRVRDIAISFANVSQEQGPAKFQLVDSIFKAIDSLGGDFGAFAATFSDDAMSKMTGGNLGWVKQNQKEKYYNDFIFYRAQKGKTYKVPTMSDNTLHIIQVVEDKPTKTGVLVTYLSRQILPSAETEKEIYGRATAFAADNQSPDKFKENGKKQNVKTVNELKVDAFNVQGLQGNAREIVKWAFKAEPNTVSSIMTVENKHVIALLESVQPKGLSTVDAVREQVKALVTREKKAELLAKKITDAGAANVDALAAKVGKPALQADKVTFGNPSLGGSYEPKVVATALGLAAGKLSAPVQGNAGVYAVQTIAVAEPAKVSDYAMYSMQLKQQINAKARGINDAHKKLAKIEDHRFDFY